MSAVQRAVRTAALAVAAAGIIAATAVALSESFRSLLGWAAAHGLPGGWAYIWPLMVDSFTVVGEMVLFVMVLDGYGWRARWPAWIITAAGLAASVAGNVGHAWADAWTWRATAAVPPLAAAVLLAVGLGMLKRLIRAARARQPAARPGWRARAALRRYLRQQARQPAPAAHPGVPSFPDDPDPYAYAAPPARPGPDPDPGPPRRPAPRRRRAAGPAAEAAALAAAADAYTISARSGRALSARQLADMHLGGNRRAAARVIAAATSREPDHASH
jgi:hypothetical protein